MVAALFIVGLIIGAGAVYGISMTSPPSMTTVTTTVAGAGSTSTVTVTSTAAAAAGGLSGNVKIGVMTDLSDGLSSEGVRVQDNAELAIANINAWLQNTTWAGKVTFSVSVLDYAVDNTKAETDLSSFQSQGIQVVVGPLNSGAAGAILSTANSDHITLISPSSTSPALAIPNDYLFRTAPDDVYQGAADARMMFQQGAKAAVIVYRDDTYGGGLANYTSAKFQALGGKTILIPYDTSTTNFVPVLQTINTDYNSLVTTYGANSVAIDAIAFEELGPMLLQAKANYPALLTTPQPWYGTDGESGDTVLTNSTYAPVMTAVRMPASVFGYTNSSKTAAICTQLLSKYGPTGSCDSYGLGAYDDVWLAALSILDCGSNSGTCVQSVLPSVAGNYYGATGWTGLNSAGDRNGGDFQVWCVEPGSSANSANWAFCGTWSALSDSVTWVSGLQPST